MSTPLQTVTDVQTGQEFEIVPESWYDVTAAWLSAAYSLAAIIYLTAVTLDTWSGQYNMWPAWLEGKLDKTVSGSVFNLMVYTAVGGGMGAAVNNLRSFISWHAERRAFGWRFLWKYLALPPLGATLAVLVYGIIQSGMAVFTGGDAPSATGITSFTAWATGTLAGYGSHKVFIWLDDKVNTLFKVETKKVAVPDVIGKTLDEAKQILNDGQLKLGNVTEMDDSQNAGKVVGQAPGAGTEVSCESEVNLVIGKSPALPPPAPPPPVITEEEAKQLPKNGDSNGDDPAKEAAKTEEVVANALTGETTGEAGP
jgi:hypothetical protein